MSRELKCEARRLVSCLEVIVLSASSVVACMPRAFFTREHVDFIDKLKFKEALEEAVKKEREELERLRGSAKEGDNSKEKGKEIEKSKAKEAGKKQGGREKDKGKGKMVDDGKEDAMKKWVGENFGNSLRILSEKLEEVDRRSKLNDGELEELKMLRVEKELRELRENSSSEKKRKMSISPLKPRAGKVKSRSGLLKKNSRGAAREHVVVSSDDESKGRDAVVQNLSSRLDAPGVSKPSELTEIKDLLKVVLAGKGQGVANAGASFGSNAEGKKDSGQANGLAKDAGTEKELGKEKEGGCDEESLGLYYKDRVVHYDSLHYTEVQLLCKSRGLTYKRKEAGVWELTHLDFEEYRASMKREDEESKVEEKSEEDEEKKDSSSESDHDSEAAVAGN
ncbi:hypothetical protein CBR_g22256 [Chara braunii]|uniref:Uncharacterized protein n=1 Tax=Chara braunii TaxID=69332 RepID=A0A388L2M1_CHABU|nr:hypothetical protein CBR_g22256 [Chara braunii]|eukprot:GBG76508.1 hypothetical protein CBR_g22256 [Chara braunii]